MADTVMDDTVSEFDPLDRGSKAYDPVADPDVIVIPKTPGGDTFYVFRDRQHLHGAALCWRLRRKKHRVRGKERCSQPAGWGTDHAGTGACRIHGGNNTNRVMLLEAVPTSGYSQFLTDRHRARFEAFLASDQPKHLYNELALLRTLLLDLVESEKWDVKEVRDTIEAIGRMVDRMERLDMSLALTQAQVQLLIVHMVALINQHVTDHSNRMAFATEFLGIFGITPEPDGSLPRNKVSDDRVIELAQTKYGMWT